MATVITSARLTLRHLGMADANFILDLLNQETFIRYIGDKGVRNLADACDYLANGPVESYRRFGFGLYLASLKDGDIPIGICGLVKRESLEDVDVGFAFLPQYCGRGLATDTRFSDSSALSGSPRRRITRRSRCCKKSACASSAWSGSATTAARSSCSDRFRRSPIPRYGSPRDQAPNGAQSSIKKLRSCSLRLGWRNLRSAFASI
jgi:hypothetical protein